MSDEPLDLLLVDDHAVVREGYRRVLERGSRYRVVGEASSAEDGYRLFCELAPDLVILDVSLPGVGGIECARRMRARDPDARIIMFSMHDDVVYTSRALEAGVRGYVTKGSPPTVLLEAVRSVAAGGIYLSHDVAQHLALNRLNGDTAPLASLSEREFEVFRLLAEGRTVAEIARALCLNYKTVANYQSSIRRKLDVETPVELVRLAMSHGLIERER